MGNGPADDGRQAFHRRRWTDAYVMLHAADGSQSLDADDLDLMATAAHLTGRREEAADAWERAHAAFLATDQVPKAVRCAFWLALTLFDQGEHSRGGGWLARAQVELDRAGLDCAERGLLRIPAALQAMNSGSRSTALAEFEQIAAVADRFGDAELRALGQLGQGQAILAGGGETARGTALLDQAMLAVLAGEVSAIAAGIVYCAAIVTCRKIFDAGRAREWTAALSRWCEDQQDLKPYRGQCLVHRSEVLQLSGEWTGAMVEVREACAHLADPPGEPALGMALYQQAELLRLRGEVSRAERTYRSASSAGHPVQPGLALLRLAQGRVEDAMAAIRRVVSDTEGAAERPRVLAACVEIALAAAEVEWAQEACGELRRIATRGGTPYLRAVAEYARGCVLLASGDATSAGPALRRAWESWQELDAPYEAARARLRTAEACLRLGDRDSAELELDAARQTFERLGATPMLAQAQELAGSGRPARPGGLTPREVDVLRLVATGASNRQIADALVISDKTVARHVANVFTKLDVSSRAAATAYAFRHGLA